MCRFSGAWVTGLLWGLCGCTALCAGSLGDISPRSFSEPGRDPSSVTTPVTTPVRMRFLVTVNDTWDPDGCIATVPTPFLVSGKLPNETEPIQVGSCDHGPLVFDVINGSDDGYSKMTVSLTFHSSVIVDAMPPSCRLPWNGTYLLPQPDDNLLSPLPSCFVRDSREGYHMTFYWFRLFEWQLPRSLAAGQSLPSL